MIVGVPKESFPDEKRVALVPASIPALSKAKLDVLIENGAGKEAGYPDGSYLEKGSQIAKDKTSLFESAEIILTVRGIDPVNLRKGQLIIGMLEPFTDQKMLRDLADKGAISFAMELIPRITRAQSMDALSSQATVAGYKAVLLAAANLPKMFPMMMTAAGTVTPARVFVIGAGVAGLQAISTARRLGAVVSAYDIRPAVKEEVLSLGAKFIEIGLEEKSTEAKGGYARQMDESFYKRQREMMAKTIAESDVVITTAAVPGKKAPRLVSSEMAFKMKPGSIIVDLAAEQGGNCELTKRGETINAGGITVIGSLNIASTVSFHASQMYSKNISNLLLQIVKDGKIEIDLKDEVVARTLLTRDGEIINEEVRKAFGFKSLQTAERGKG
jgi:NAD(P) transhydrogenase subunit alpha